MCSLFKKGRRLLLLLLLLALSSSAVRIWYTAETQPRGAKLNKENESLCLKVLPLFMDESSAGNREAFLELLYHEMCDEVSVLTQFEKGYHNLEEGHPFSRLEVMA